MPKNKSYIIALIVIVAASITFIVNSKKDNVADSRLIAEFNAESITQFLIKKEGEKEIKIHKDPELKKWILESEAGVRQLIDVKKVVSLLDFLQDTNIVNRVTKKTDSYAKFEVTDKQAVRIELMLAKTEPVVIYLGKSNDKSRQFVRKNNDPYVYLLAKKFQPDWNQENWYFKNILMWPLESLKEVQYSVKQKDNLPLVYDANTKKLVTTAQPPKNQKPKDLNDIFNGFKNLSVKKFVKIADSPKTIKKITHNLLFQDGTQLELQFLKSKKKKKTDAERFFLHIEAKGSASPMKNYLSALSKQYIFELNSFNENQFAKQYDAFYEEIPKPKEAAEEKMALPQPVLAK